MTARSERRAIRTHSGYRVRDLERSTYRRTRVTITFFIIVLTSLFSIQTEAPFGHAEAVVTTITVGVNPSGIAFDTSTNTIYVSNYGLNGTFPSTLTVVNGSNNKPIGTISVGVNPAGLAVNSLTHKAYVANYNSSNVSVITGISNSTTTITVGTHPTRVAVNAATNRIYVANAGSGTVSVINGATNTVTNTIFVGRSPVGIATMPSINRAFVSNSLDNTVSIIDTQSNTVIKTIAAGNDPGGIAADNSTKLVYVVNSNSSSGMITVIDGVTNTVAYNMQVGAFPTGIDLNPLTNKIYVANSADGTVSVVDGFTKTEVNTVALPNGVSPGAVGVDLMTNEIYVSNGGIHRTLSVISGSPSGTSVSCNPSQVPVGSTTICTATVIDTSGSGSTTPTGPVYFLSNGMGSFNSTICILTATGTTASCAISYSPTAVGAGSVTIFSTFGGDSKHMSSSNQIIIGVSAGSGGLGGGGRMYPA